MSVLSASLGGSGLKNSYGGAGPELSELSLKSPGLFPGTPSPVSVSSLDERWGRERRQAEGERGEA